MLYDVHTSTLHRDKDITTTDVLLLCDSQTKFCVSQLGSICKTKYIYIKYLTLSFADAVQKKYMRSKPYLNFTCMPHHLEQQNISISAIISQYESWSSSLLAHPDPDSTPLKAALLTAVLVLRGIHYCRVVHLQWNGVKVCHGKLMATFLSCLFFSFSFFAFHAIPIFNVRHKEYSVSLKSVFFWLTVIFFMYYTKISKPDSISKILRVFFVFDCCSTKSPKLLYF